MRTGFHGLCSTSRWRWPSWLRRAWGALTELVAFRPLRTASPPATRYQSAVALSHELGNARLLTLNGWGHTAFGQPSACANAAEVGYLVDLKLPPPGTVCQVDHGPFTPAAGAMPLAHPASFPGLDGFK